MASDQIVVVRAEAQRRAAALRILFSPFPADEQGDRLRDALLSAERGSLDLSGLWLAEDVSGPVGATLVMHQRDGVSLVWPPVVAGTDEKRVAAALMRQICQELDQPGVKFGQVLLSPEEKDEAALLSEYGFEMVAELFFLARSLEEPYPEPAWEPDIEVETFDETVNVERFARLIERTYLGSLDCPRLNGTRTGTDAIAGHRLSGTFHPQGWRLYRVGGRDAAVLLLNEHPDQDAVELVYFGVAPEFRGRGLGRRLLADAMTTSRSWKRAAIFLAVDAGNTFANGVYAEFGFQEVARRQVWLKFQADSARQ